MWYVAEWRVEAWQSDFRVCACNINKEKSSGAVVKKKHGITEMGEVQRQESRNTKGTRKYFQLPFLSFLLPLEKAFVVVGCRTL